MDRHFLVAVSQQKTALNGIRFIGKFFSDKRRVKATLFYAGPEITVPLDEEHCSAERTSDKELLKQMRADGEHALKAAEDRCLALGFHRKNIHRKTKESRLTIAEDIIGEGGTGQYDAVVLGRRSLGIIESALEGSVSKTLLLSEMKRPLWICRSIRTDRKNILLIGDGTQGSYTMAAHVGAVVGMENRHRVDILMADHILKDTHARDKYETILARHNVPAKQLRRIKAEKGDPADRILNLVNRNGYAAVALGKSNPKQNLFSRLLKGPVCSVLYRHLQHAGLWVAD